jgi:hypothetical protein
VKIANKRNNKGILPDDTNTLKPDHSAVRDLAYELGASETVRTTLLRSTGLRQKNNSRANSRRIEEMMKVPTPVLKVWTAGKAGIT